jgi:hypothetical protein
MANNILKSFIVLVIATNLSFDLYGKGILRCGFQDKNQMNDTTGVLISSRGFDSLVQSLLMKFSSDTSVKLMDDYIVLVKAANTIAFGQLNESSRYCKELYDLFLFKYLNIIVKLTDAKLSKGLSYYSKKYDLLIGGGKYKTNYYRITR